MENGGWGTVRCSSVPTTDVAVEDIPVLRSWLRVLLATRLRPMLAACYPRLADGSTLGARGERLRVHDAFIVRYDARRDMSLSLPEHSDTSAISLTLGLNDSRDLRVPVGDGGDGRDGGSNDGFEGGGTWFQNLGLGGRVVNADAGQAVAFAGPMRHAGFPITSGTRVILVVFMYVVSQTPRIARGTRWQGVKEEG